MLKEANHAPLSCFETTVKPAATCEQGALSPGADGKTDGDAIRDGVDGPAFHFLDQRNLADKAQFLVLGCGRVDGQGTGLGGDDPGPVEDVLGPPDKDGGRLDGDAADVLV